MGLWTGTCPGGNATDPIWRVLASSRGIPSWTHLKPQHSNPNPNPLGNQLWCIDFLTPPTSLLISHRLLAFLESLMPLKNWCSIHARWSKSCLRHSIRVSVDVFPSLKQNFFVYRSSKVSSRQDCIFEIHQLWQPGFSRVYSNKILNLQESTTISNVCTKSLETYWMHHLCKRVVQTWS